MKTSFQRSCSSFPSNFWRRHFVYFASLMGLQTVRPVRYRDCKPAEPLRTFTQSTWTSLSIQKLSPLILRSPKVFVLIFCWCSHLAHRTSILLQDCICCKCRESSGCNDWIRTVRPSRNGSLALTSTRRLHLSDRPGICSDYLPTRVCIINWTPTEQRKRNNPNWTTIRHCWGRCS